MEKFRNLLSSKVAGIPVSVILVIVAGIGLYLAVRMPKAVPEVEEDTETSDDTVLEGDGVDEGQPAFRANTVLYTAGTSTTSTLTETNEQWGRKAKAWLIGGGISTDLATRAIDKYLAGEEQTVEEAAQRDKAVTQFGLPPEEFTYGGIAPVTTPTVSDDTGVVGDTPAGAPVETAPDPVPAAPAVDNTPPTAQGVPPTTHVVRNGRDNQAGDLSLLYYGVNDAEHRNKIMAGNDNSKGNPPWAPGTRIYIPQWVNPQYFITTKNVKGANDIAAKNGTTADKIRDLNPGKSFPVGVGVRVRVR